MCNRCKTQAIEIYDKYNHPLNYRSIIDDYMKNIYTSNKFTGIDNIKYDIYDMKCRKCGQHYSIIWRNNYPLPDLTGSGGRIKEFIDFFILEGLK